jgi:type IV secretion system protein VirB6
MAMTPFFDIWKTLVDPFKATAMVLSDTLTSAVIPLVLAGLTIHIVWQGFNMLRGNGGQHVFIDLFMNNMRTIVVLLFALGSASLFADLDIITTELITVIANAGNNTAANTIPGVFDGMMDKVFDLDIKVRTIAGPKISFFPIANTIGLEMIGSAYVIEGLIVLIMGIAFAALIVIQFGIYFAIGVAPLFIAAAGFKSTSNYFSGWISGILRYSFESVLIMIIVGFSIKIFNGFLINISNLPLETEYEVLYSSIFLVFVNAVIIFILLTQVHSIVGSLFGSGGVQAVGAAIGAAAGAAMGVRSAMSHGQGGKAQQSQTEAIGAAVEKGMGKALDSRSVGGSGGSATGSITPAQRSGMDTLGPDAFRSPG